MFIGFLISFLIFGGIAYFLSKLSLNLGFERDNRFLAVLFYFLVPLLSLSILSLILVGIYSLMGLSVSLAAEAIAHSLSANTSGALVVIGSILTAIYGIAAIAAGPATAFTASQVVTVIAAIAVVASPDRALCQKWLPWVAFAVYGFCMWPFAAILTFGL